MVTDFTDSVPAKVYQHLDLDEQIKINQRAIELRAIWTRLPANHRSGQIGIWRKDFEIHAVLLGSQIA